ncbi:MAG: DUF2271 domain-containing protein [Phycisphaerae bacterium]|nr:DUF2271 domain-containing protein [Tepidisphaeraceae bacterium]
MSDQLVTGYRFASAAALAVAAVGGVGVAAPEARGMAHEAPSAVRGETLPEYTFRHEYVLGTSMEMTVRADGPAVALACQHAVLGEIDRLARVLSTYDGASTISRAMRTGVVDDGELAELLELYETWQGRTGGALSPDLAGVIAIWKSAAVSGVLPTEAELRAARGPGGLAMLNVDSLGKAFIIDKAVAAGRRVAPSGLLNIGGDLRTWGIGAWRVAVTDPANCADNARPLTEFDLTDAAVATSGGYLRNVTIRGQRYSHVIDGRTLRPTAADVGVTVVAADCLTANAVSTAACALGPAEGARLAKAFGATGFITAGGAWGGVAPVGGAPAGPVPFAEPAKPAPAPAAAPAGAWPKDHVVTVDVGLKAMGGGKRYRRPYVAVWVENAAGKPVRTVTLWGDKDKYLRDMTAWWRATGGTRNVPRGVTRATRDPGKYSVVWDGLDDAGKALPKGDYTIVVEISREHGGHVKQSVKLPCGGDKAEAAKLTASAESDETNVTYGVKGK